MNNYIQYINEFHEWNQVEIDFVNNQLKKHLEINEENQTEIEHILDFLFSNPKTNISKIWYVTIKEKADKWTTKIQSKVSKDTEQEWVDYDIFLDFKDWFKIVTLKSESSYIREGKLMSHCVGSYYGRDKIIYSLRDSKNNPHCTIEHGQQIKGKGNWNIDPKYIDYIVQFLEHTWMTVWENEMKNLGYYKLEKIDTGLTCEKQYNWYVYESNISLIKDKDYNQYQWFWLLNIKDIVTFEGDFKFKINFDIAWIVKYVVWLFKNSESDNRYAQIWSSWNSAQIWSSWDSAQIWSSWDSARIWSSWYSAQIWSSWYSARIWSSWDYAQIWSSWNSAQIWSSWNSAQIWSSWDYAQIWSSWDYARILIEWQYSIGSAIGHNSKIKWVKWTWVVLAEYEQKNWKLIPKIVKTAQIDWEILKENTFYTLSNWEFTEVTE